MDQFPVRIVTAKGFEPARTQFDWLSRDPEAVDAYLADPLCGSSLDAEGMRQVAVASTALAQPRDIPAHLPVYVLVGDRDPLNDGLALSDLLVDRYRQAGLTDITYRIHPEARHELFNETNHAEVEGDLLAWLERVLTHIENERVLP